MENVISKKEILEFLQTYQPLIGQYINTEDIFKYFYNLPKVIEIV